MFAGFYNICLICSLFGNHSTYPSIFVLDQDYPMNSIGVFDENKNRAVELIIQENNSVEGAYCY